MPGASPTNLATTTSALFFTRWITHFCAPAFFLLTGTGAFLRCASRRHAELSRFLLHARAVADLPRARRAALLCAVQRRLPSHDAHGALGARLGDDRARRRSCWLPRRCVAAIGAGDDRRAQPVRRRAVRAIRSGRSCTRRASSLNRPAHVVFRRLSADALDRRDGGRLRARPDLSTGRGAAARVPAAAAGSALTSAFVVLRARQRLRRSRAVGGAAIGGVHARLVPQRDQVSAVAAVPADDARARRCCSCARWTAERRRLLRPALVYRPGAAVLLRRCTSSLIHLLAVVVVLRAVRRRALDVRVAESRQVPVHARRRAGGSHCPWCISCGRVVVVASYPLCRWYAGVKQRRADLWWLSYL